MIIDGILLLLATLTSLPHWNHKEVYDHIMSFKLMLPSFFWIPYPLLH